jgi:hypothetical protein
MSMALSLDWLHPRQKNSLISWKIAQTRQQLSGTGGDPNWTSIHAGLARHGFAYSVFGDKGAVDRFMSGDVNIIVAQLGKGAYGLNLTRATRMIYHSLPWDLDIYSQSQERNMRLTTTADYLEIVHLIVAGSVDGYVRNRLLEKADISATLSRSQALAILRGEK